MPARYPYLCRTVIASVLAPLVSCPRITELSMPSRLIRLAAVACGSVITLRRGWGVSFQEPATPLQRAAITAPRFSFLHLVRFPIPGHTSQSHTARLTSSAHEKKKGIEADSPGSGHQLTPRRPHLGDLRGAVDRPNPITEGNWPHDGLASHLLRCGRHKRSSTKTG